MQYFSTNILGHTGASQVKGDMSLAGWQVMWLAAVEPRSVNMHHLRTNGWARGQSICQLGR